MGKSLRYKLHIRDDSGETTVVPVTREKITVGRQEGNTIRLTERNVSRVHARIVCKDDAAVFVEDVSRYGVRVNGLRIAQRTSVSSSDVIAIGDYELTIVPEGKPADTVPATPVAPSMKPQGLQSRMTAETTVEPALKADSTAMISLTDLETAARSKGAAQTRVVADRPTLVALNTALAGREFPLGADKIIIGRTDDNDVVVDHRSISRNHARVEIEQGRVTIYDLESANGLKVNDDFYKLSVLRRGDVIELGHVRMRFVEAGETFVYQPEEWDAGEESAKAGGGQKKLLLVVGLVVAAAVAVAAVVLTGGDPPTPSKVSASSKKSGTTPAPEPDTESKATQKSTSKASASAQPSKTPPTASEHGASLARARASQDEGKWGPAQDICRGILAQNPDHAEASRCVSDSSRELRVLKAYTEAENLNRARQYVSAWEALEAVKDDVDASRSRGKIESLRKMVRLKAVGELVQDAKRAHKAKKYQTAIKMSEQALALDPTDSGAKKWKRKALAGRSKSAGSDGTGPSGPAKESPKTKTKVPKKNVPIKVAPAPKEPVEAPVKMSWRDYYKKAAKAGSGKLAVYKEAASKGFAKAYYYIGRTHMVNGNTGAAKAAFKRFLKLKPNHPAASQARDFITQLGG